jgi:signal transduction histidine kinase
MKKQAVRVIAWLLVGVYLILSIIGLILMKITNTTPGDIAFPIPLFIISVIVIGIWPVIGALIINYYPNHPVGWLLFATFPLSAIDMFAIGYSSYALSHPSLFRIPDVILLWLNWSGLPFVVLSLTILFLIFPTGNFLSSRWRIVAWTAAGALGTYLCLQTIAPGSLSIFPKLDNPFATREGVWNVLEPLYIAVICILIFCSLASLVSLIQRLYRSQGDERQQVKWLLLPAALFWIGLPINLFPSLNADKTLLGIGIGIHLLAVPAIVVAVALAVFKYRLYDVDIIINRTLVFGALTVSVVGLYILIVGGASLIVQSNLFIAGVLITAVLAGFIYRPVHLFFQSGVDRLMYGKGESINQISATSSQNSAWQSKVKSNSPRKSKTPLFHQTMWYEVARKAWYPVFAIALGIFLASIPGFFIMGKAGITDSRFSANPSPLISILAWITIVGSVVVSLLSLLLSAYIFQRRSSDRMALLTSFFLLAYGVIMAGPLEALEPYLPKIADLTQNILIPGCMILSLYLFAVFPDGRFIPRWTRWIVLFALLAVPVSLYWNYQFSRYPLDLSHPSTLLFVTISIVFAVGTWAVISYAQFYRYHHVMTPDQKQQAKWIVYGIGVWFTLLIASTIPWTLSYTLPPGTPIPLWLVAGSIPWICSTAVIPIVLTIAVLRYRLFEIDFLINRSLVYGGLTAIVALTYILIVGGMGAIFHGRGNFFIALIATGLVAVLFQPVRERLQRALNKLIFGERDDPINALSQLGKRLETAILPEEVLPTVVASIAQTLKLPYVAIILPGEKGERVAAAYGEPTSYPIRIPLTYQGEAIGQLVINPRSPGESFSSSEMQLIQTVAGQAGAAAHSVRLTYDLLRSRQQLVTAREEERRRLRRDLHDGLGPTLAALHVQMNSLRRLIHSDPQAADLMVDEFKAEIKDSINEIRRVVYELRPPTLDEFGLVEAARVYASNCSQEVSQRYSQKSDFPNGQGLNIKVENPEDLPILPAAVEVAAYHVVREALANVVHHSQAHQCLVRFLAEKDLIVEVIDDGIGICADNKAGVGMLSMKERAEELGGKCIIEPGSKKGTHVMAYFPLFNG